MTEFTLVAQKIKEVVTVEGREGERDGGRNDRNFFPLQERERVIYLFINLNGYYHHLPQPFPKGVIV